MPSAGRVLHQAARAEQARRFSSDFTSQPPYAALHPAFVAAVREYAAWPAPADYDRLAHAVPQAPGTRLPRFVLQSRERLARFGGYERHVAEIGQVPTREQSWHDFFNMAVWAHFPRTRWALNRVHTAPTRARVDPRNGRTPRQNLAAQLDESGIIVASSDRELLEDLRALRFKSALWHRRGELLATTCFRIVGHGTLESLLSPHPALACKAVLLELTRPAAEYHDDALRFELDERAAREVDGWGEEPARLAPLPVLGIPGYADDAHEAFYDDARYFRVQRVRSE